MALSAEPALTADAWSLLAHYSWDTDEGQLLASRDAAATLTALAQACPQPDAAARLALHAQVAGRRPADAGALLAVITDARLARANMDLLNNSGIELMKAAAEGRVELVAALSAVARTWSGDLWLSASDRLTALRLQMRLTRLGAPVADLPEQVSQQVAELLAGPAILMNATRWSTPPSARCTTPAWRSKPKHCCWPNCRVRIRPTISCSAWSAAPSGAATRPAC